jgi:hypothetical protein
MKTLTTRTFQLQQITNNIVLLTLCLLPFLIPAFLLNAYLSKYQSKIPFLFLIIVLPFFVTYSYVITAEVEVTIDSFGLKCNVTKSGLLVSKGETAFVWSSLKSFAKKGEGRRRKPYLLVHWEGAKSQRFSGESSLALYECLRQHFPEKESKSSWVF